jgi:hypothetical protein
MTYFADLSDYIYWGAEPQISGAKNVGWLSADHSFPRAEPLSSDLDVIWEYCKVRVYQTRGLHDCPFCEEWFEKNLFRIRHRGEMMNQGDAEILIVSEEHGAFAAPNLIFHYMRDHQYLPPEPFLLALRSVDPIPSQAYRQQLDEAGIYWSKYWRICPEDL